MPDASQAPVNSDVFGGAAATDVAVLIIGSGFGGLGMGIKLKAAGIHDFVILERGQGVGGTWRENTYPGCACDVQSHLYSYSFEQNAGWSRMFAPQAEIRAYLEHCTDKYELRPHLRFGRDVSSARYDELTGTWTVLTQSGERFRARSLVSAMGAFSNPSIPSLPGLDKFAGKTFHSARWDHDYDLRGKRVAVIGTGASAIQFVPQIQKQVAKLDLYQRTAPWIMPKSDRAVTGFERFVFRLAPLFMWLYRIALYWSLELRVLGFIRPKLMQQVERIATWHLHRQVKDRTLRKKLRPTYRFGCKRVLISNDYYPALTQPNVDVIDTGIAEIRENGIVAKDGTFREVDAILFGTGFNVQQMLPRGALFGRGGVDITDVWAEAGMQAYKGIHVSGFPNFHMVLGPNTGLGHSSMIFMIESQVAYIVDAIKQLHTQGWKSLDVKLPAQRGYAAKVQATNPDNVWASGCKSWYIDEQGRNTALWPSFTFVYRKQTSRFVPAAYTIERLEAPRAALLQPAAEPA